jgi:hypothetical protein
VGEGQDVGEPVESRLVDFGQNAGGGGVRVVGFASISESVYEKKTVCDFLIFLSFSSYKCLLDVFAHFSDGENVTN